jgi:phytoene desaturase
MYAFVDALRKIFEEHGGKWNINSEVDEIVTKNQKITGIKVNGEFKDFDVVVSNGDLTHTNAWLLRNTKLKNWNNNKLEKAKYSMSTFVLYIGVKKKYPELLHHTLILSERYRELVKDIFDNHVLPDDFSMYLHVPSKTDPTMAPEGCESIYVLAPVTNLENPIDWKEKGKEFADKILHHLEHEFGMEGLNDNLDYISWITPEDFKEKRNSHLGSPWGLEPNLLQTAYFRPHNVSPDVENMYYVGAGTHPGAGVPGVLLSAEATTKLVVKDNPL